MVWIPGSAFQYGTATAWYDGSHFARDGIVCVTINYRVGVDGFLYLGDGIANLGLLDQVAALKWVQENIAAFGGDPQNVTIFGESAGEVVASMLLWQPVVDGDVIPARPIDRMVAGAGADIDVMVGTNTDDWRLFLVAPGAIDHVTDEALVGAVADYGFWAVAAYGLPVEATLAAYRAAHPGASAGDLLAAIQTDWWCRIPAIRLADAHAKNTSATSWLKPNCLKPSSNGLLPDTSERWLKRWTRR